MEEVVWVAHFLELSTDLPGGLWLPVSSLRHVWNTALMWYCAYAGYFPGCLLLERRLRDLQSYLKCVVSFLCFCRWCLSLMCVFTHAPKWNSFSFKDGKATHLLSFLLYCYTINTHVKLDDSFLSYHILDWRWVFNMILLRDDRDFRKPGLLKKCVYTSLNSCLLSEWRTVRYRSFSFSHK